MAPASVAAIELISPRNKDRPQSRHEFVVKCASLLKAQVSLVLIDIVTDRRANLLRELMEYLEKTNPQAALGYYREVAKDAPADSAEAKQAADCIKALGGEASQAKPQAKR